MITQETASADAPAPPAATAASGSQGQAPSALTIQVPLDATPAEIYQALRNSQNELRNQLNRAEGEREEIAQQLRQQNPQGADKEGLEQQLRVLDTRIQDLRQQLADAETRVATAAAVPGSTRRTQEQMDAEFAETMAVGGIFITLAIVIPLSIGYARRLWKRHAVTVALSPELETRLDSIDRAVEATAIEVERIGEGQRFVTQLMAQQRQPARERLPSSALREG